VAVRFIVGGNRSEEKTTILVHFASVVYKYCDR